MDFCSIFGCILFCNHYISNVTYILSYVYGTETKKACLCALGRSETCLCFVVCVVLLDDYLFATGDVDVARFGLVDTTTCEVVDGFVGVEGGDGFNTCL